MNYEIISFKNDEIELEVVVSPEENTVWLTKEQIATLFNRDRSVISRHINKLFNDGGIDRDSSVHFLHITTPYNSTQTFRQPEYFNLDVIVSVGQRIRSKVTSIFYSWSIDVLSNSSNGYKNKSNIIRFDNENVSLDVRIVPEEETVWLNQGQMSLLYDSTQQNISLHIKNILNDKELDSNSVHKDFLYTASDGKAYCVDFYNLDMILAVGYRVKTKRAIAFRKWATSVLKEYLFKGYALDENRAIITKENYLNLRREVESLGERMNELEKKQKYSFIEDKILFEGQMFDSLVLINKIIETSKEEIVLIDPYVDVDTLDTFRNKNVDAELKIITSCNSKISKKIIEKFNHKYGNLTVNRNDKYHDRYLIIDRTIFYHLGSSINYLGKKFSQITLIKDKDIIETLLKRILVDI